MIELATVLSVLSILALLAMPLAEMTVTRAKERELKYALREIRQALDSYKRASDEAKLVKDGVASGYPPTLELLVEGVFDASTPQNEIRHFLRRVPRDPFSNSVVSAEKTWGLRSYASTADDPKSGDDIYDIYSLSEKIGLNRIPYREW